MPVGVLCILLEMSNTEDSAHQTVTGILFLLGVTFDTLHWLT